MLFNVIITITIIVIDLRRIKMKKYSRQRDAVFHAVASVKTHPTASEVYDSVRKTIPNISLATVYRNLSDLCADGRLITVVTEDGVTHYDAILEKHSHLLCSECKNLIDVNIPVSIGNVSVPDLEIDRFSVIFYGRCPECAK